MRGRKALLTGSGAVAHPVTSHPAPAPVAMMKVRLVSFMGYLFLDAA